MGDNLNSKESNNNSVQSSEIYRGFGEGLGKRINFREDINKIPVQSLNFYSEFSEVVKKHTGVSPTYLLKEQERHDYFLKEQHKLSSETKALFNKVRTYLKEDVVAIYNRDLGISNEAAKTAFHSGHFQTYQKSGYFDLEPGEQIEIASTMRPQDLLAKPSLTLKLTGATLMSWSAKGMEQNRNRIIGRDEL